MATKKPIKYKIEAWVHPKKGGDDYMIRGKTFGTRATVIKALKVNLRKRGSAILTDYKIKKVK